MPYKIPSMKLIHYDRHPIPSLEPRTYPQPTDSFRKYLKPHGLWVSVEEGEGWKDWCSSEGWNLEGLKYEHEIILKNTANILILKTADEIIDFTKEYVCPEEYYSPFSDQDTDKIEWNRLKEKYQGIIISPYQFSCRLSLETSWYYSWDCASGSIWDLSCVEYFRLLNTIPIMVEKKDWDSME